MPFPVSVLAVQKTRRRQGHGDALAISQKNNEKGNNENRMLSGGAGATDDSEAGRVRGCAHESA